MNGEIELLLHRNQLPAPTVGSLAAYIRAVNGFPVLDAETEFALARRFRSANDLEAAQQLVLANLRSVVHIARGYMGYGLPLADLIQEGNIGLMKAVRRFDPDVGVRVISFAVYWIRAEIHEFVIRNWRIVKVATTKAQRKLFFNLRGAKKRLAWMNRDEVEAVAADLKVTPEEVLEMEGRLSSRDVSFSAGPADGDDESTVWGPEQYLEAEGADPAQHLIEKEWNIDQVDRLSAALTTLDERSLDIVRKRWLAASEKAGLQELADRYGISAERVRQIELQAMKKLRIAV